MKSRKQNIILLSACLLAFGANSAQANEEGVYCGSETPQSQLEMIKNALKTDPNCKNFNWKTARLVGPQTCKEDGVELSGEQCQIARDVSLDVAGKGFVAKAEIQWNHRRAGFVEWCEGAILSCDPTN